MNLVKCSRLLRVGFSLPALFGSLALAEPAGLAPVEPASEGCQVELKFGYVKNGSRVEDSVTFGVKPTEVSEGMQASLLALSAGRTIQTLVRDFHAEKQKATPQPPEPPIFRPLPVLGLALPKPVVEIAPKQPGEFTEPVQTDDEKDAEARGKRFAAAARDYAKELEAGVAKMAIPSGSPLKKQFHDLVKDFEKLAVAFETDKGFSMWGGGMRAAFSMASLEIASSSAEVSDLESGGVMTDAPFWSRVKRGEVPELEAFSLDGFIKRFRLNTVTSVPKELAAKHSVIPLGDGYYDPESERLVVKINAVTPIAESAFKRPALDLVVALDVSGSMGTSDTDAGKSRLEGAKSALTDMVRNLRDDDRISLVLFDHETKIAVEPLMIGGADRQTQLMDVINKIQTQGATDLGKAQAKGYEILRRNSRPGVERRLVLITDAMTNTGEINNKVLAASAAKEGSDPHDPVYTTVIGVGEGFNQSLSADLAAAPGGIFYYAESGEALYKLFANFDTRMVTFATHFVASLELHGFPSHSRVVAVHGSGVEGNNAIAVGQSAVGRRLLDTPTLKFADQRRIDPNAGGGAFLIEIDLRAPASP